MGRKGFMFCMVGFPQASMEEPRHASLNAHRIPFQFSHSVCEGAKAAVDGRDGNTGGRILRVYTPWNLIGTPCVPIKKIIILKRASVSLLGSQHHMPLLHTLLLRASYSVCSHCSSQIALH